MNFIPLEKITVKENRQRKEFDINAHQELITSITETAVGLQNPLVLRQEGDTFVLLSGERRLRAIRDAHELGTEIRFAGVPIPKGEVPYVLVAELSEIDAEEAELEENIRRKDLTWGERAQATSRLMALRTKQNAAAALPPPTLSDIAKETSGKSGGWYAGEVRKEVLVAKYLDDPDVHKAATLDEAFKILKKKDRAKQHAALAEAVGTSVTLASHKIFNEDCLEWMKAQPEMTYDVILSDPPYGMGADTFGDSGGKTEGAHFYQDDDAYWAKLMEDLCPELYRLAKPFSHAYLFCDFNHFHRLSSYMKQAGWDVFRTPLIWHKPGGSRTPWVNGGPQRRYECILFARKGDRPVNMLRGDVLEHMADTNLGHNAQKPVALYRDLLERSALPGDKILDPFCGSGPIFPAAHALKCIATGVEMDAAAYGIAINRLKEL